MSLTFLEVAEYLLATGSSERIPCFLCFCAQLFRCKEGILHRIEGLCTSEKHFLEKMFSRFYFITIRKTLASYGNV